MQDHATNRKITSHDAEESDRDVMASTGHIDPRSLVYYDRSHASVERNATHILAEYLAA